MDVAARAMSVGCPHCHKRLTVEDLRVHTYHGARDLATCGDVLVEKRGHVVASTVRAGNLTIKGKLQGNITAAGAVNIQTGATVRGDIDAPMLVVENGAELDCFVRIEPHKKIGDKAAEDKAVDDKAAADKAAGGDAAEPGTPDGAVEQADGAVAAGDDSEAAPNL